MSANKKTILIAEDEPEVRNYLEIALRCLGYAVEVAENGEEVLASLEANSGQISLVLLDIMMPHKDGIETLREIRRIGRQVPVVMLSGAASTNNVVEAIKNGATDFLAKPASHEDLDKVIRKALATLEETVEIEEPLESEAFFPGAWCTRPMQAHLKQIGNSDVPVLIEGETGAGKEVLARFIHANSPRVRKPFLKLNCAALPSELIESELFGYERGAFTGAFKNKPGKFEIADGGTILLDEIGDMDFKLQAKLLHVLQDREFERLGGKDPVRVNVRVLAATHCDLVKAIDEGKFREDLYYRLNVISVRVPSLRERRDEIAPLAEHLLRKHAAPGSSIPVITPALRSALTAHHWPGNVRELENFMRRLLVTSDPERLAKEVAIASLRRRPRETPDHAQESGPGPAVPAEAQPAPPVPPESAANGERVPNGTGPHASILEKVSEAKRLAETQAILRALDTTHWNRKQAAQLLNIDYKALLYKMRKLAIEEAASRANFDPIH